jgi:hypothetical protein
MAERGGELDLDYIDEEGSDEGDEQIIKKKGVSAGDAL